MAEAPLVPATEEMETEPAFDSAEAVAASIDEAAPEEPSCPAGPESEAETLHAENDVDIFSQPNPTPAPLAATPLAAPLAAPLVSQTAEIDVSSFQRPPVTAASPPPVTEPEPEKEPEDSRTQITDWMMSFQEPPPAEPEPEPVPPPVEEAQPYRSAEFEISLSGDESVEELVQMIARNPDDEKIRAAILRAFADDVPGLLKVFRELSLEAPEEPYHVLNLARAYAHSGSDSLAVLQYRKYVKMEATSEGYRELGQIYERMGKADLAAQALSRSEQLGKREAE